MKFASTARAVQSFAPAMTAGTFFVLFAVNASAQTPPASAAAAPAATASEPLAYRSAFEGYRAYAEGRVAPWRATNETVREAGGWRAYAREAQADPAAAPAASPATPPANSVSKPDTGPVRNAAPTNPHAGHEKH